MFRKLVCRFPVTELQSKRIYGEVVALYNNFNTNYALSTTVVLVAGLPVSIACFISPLAHVHLKGFIVDDNKSLCRLAGTPLAALCSADSRWPGKTTAFTLFLGRPEKGVKDKRGSFVGTFYETQADPRRPLASSPPFRRG